MAILTGWTPRERHAVLAAYLGWALDAFDFFVLVFVLKDVAATFDVPVSGVAWALTLTLAFRPLGAFIFGRLDLLCHPFPVRGGDGRRLGHRCLARIRDCEE